jgi:hypothetical protein
MIPEPFLTVYLIHRHQKPFKRFPFFVEFPNQRAEAAVRMRSLRVTMLLFDRSQCVVWLRPAVPLWLDLLFFSSLLGRACATPTSDEAL